MWSYRTKRTLGLFASLAAIGIFTYLFFNISIPEKPDMKKEAYVVFANTYVAYNNIFYAITPIIAFLGFWKWISNDTEKVAGDIAVILFVGILSSAVSYLMTEGSLLKAIYLIAIYAAFFFMLLFATGRNHSSSKAISEMVNRMKELEREVNFIGGNANTPINIVQINTIPSNLNNISSMKYEDLNCTLNKYTRGLFAKSKEEKRMVLIGDFGSGKSTALLQCIIKSLSGPILPNKIPVYIRLKDIIKIQPNNNTVSSVLKADIFEHNYTSDDIKHIVKKYLEDLEKSSRIVFFFDGLNEVLQSCEKGNEKNKDMKSISEICKKTYMELCNVASGQSFVLTTCTFPDAITDGMIGQKHIPEIFAIKGVRLDYKQTQSQWINKYEVLINSSVALRGLKEINENKEHFYQFTPYELLRQFTLSDRDIDEGTEEGKGQTDDLCRALNTIIESNKRNRYNPYATLTSSITFDKTRMFHSNPFTPCHILFFEFLLAQYARTLISDKLDEFIDFFFKGLRKQEEEPQTDEEEKLLFDFQHMSNAFKMLITDIYINPRDADETNKCNKVIKQIYKAMLGKLEEDKKGKYIVNEEKKERIVNYFVLLSNIKDEIMLYGKSNQDIGSFSIELDKKLNEVWSIFTNKNAPLSFRFQMTKLFSNKVEKSSINSLLNEVLAKEWIYTGVQRQIIHYYIENDKNWSLTKNKRIDKYLMQEYPAELLRLDGMIEDVSASKTEDLKRRLGDFYVKRLRGIRHTNIWYGVIICILLVQVYFLGLYDGVFHWPALIIKGIGLALAIGSCNAWKKQLWKNEEYYGLALNNFSLDEPIYEVIKVVLGKNNKETGQSAEAKTIADDKATIVIGDWLKNRPSIIFLLATVISSIYIHTLLQHHKIENWPSYMLESLIMLALLFVCCIPNVTYYYKQININGVEEKNKKDIIKVMGFLVAVVFGLPMLATTCGELFWGWEAGLAFSIIGLVLFSIMWILFVRKAEGESKSESIRSLLTELKSKRKWKRMFPCIKERIKGKNIIPLERRVLAFVVLLTFFCIPGVTLNWIFPVMEDNPANSQAGAAIAVFMLALSVYFSLYYASWARSERKKKNDKHILRNNEETIDSYMELSCGGQIRFLNKLRNTEKGQQKIISKMQEYQGKAKTVAALDILLDIESSDVHSILH